MDGTSATRGGRIEPMTPTTTFPPCPACGAADPVPIVYGLPGLDLFEAAERGEVVLGGCLVGSESPEFECRGCGLALPWVDPVAAADR